MGYWSIVIEGTGAHHNPDFAKDANRQADEFVKQLRAAGHDVRRAAFLFDYKGEDAGDTLPYHEPKWALSRNEIPLAVEGPYHVHETIAFEGATPLYTVRNGKYISSWHTEQRVAVEFAARYNETAARTKPIAGASRDDITEEVLDGVKVRRLTHDDGRVTTYWDRPADGVVYRAYSEGGGHDAFEWNETYDLDLGGEVYLSWTYGGGDPEGSQPIGAHIHYREPLYPAGWGGGGMTFSHADERWRSYEQDGVKKYRPTWDVQAWTPLTVTPSLLIHGHETGQGRTADVHGFVTGGRWIPA